MAQRSSCLGGCLGGLFKLLLVGIFGCAVFYGVIAVTDPWAFHIGGRSTPFLTWKGLGKLQTKGGTQYPLYVYFFPSTHSSRLRREGLRPTGGLQGQGWLCTSRGVTQYLNLSGTIYGGWRSTEGSLVAFRLLEPKIIDVGQGQGFFDLSGRWQGQKLAMDYHGSVPEKFRSGLLIEQPSVTFDWGTYSDFKAACASATNLPPHR
jgi:hypothetical protein